MRASSRLPGLLLFFLPQLCLAATVELGQEPTAVQLGPHMAYLAETKKDLTINEVSSAPWSAKFTPSDSDVLNFGFTKSAYWFRFKLKNTGDRNQDLMLEIPHPVLDHIEFYSQKPDGGFTRHIVGESYPHGNKIVRHYNFLFPVQLAAGEAKWIYFRVLTTGSMQVPLTLWPIKDFVEHTQDYQVFFGMLAGFLVIMIFYNLFLFLAIRDPSYLYYTLFVTSLFCWEGTVLGLAQEYLWPGSPWLAEKAYCWGALGNLLFIMLFTRQFMNLPRLLPLMSKIVSSTVLVALAGILLTPVLPYRLTIIFSGVFAASGALFCMVLSIFALAKGFKPARYYLAAWAVFMLGIFMFASNKFGLLPRSMLTENAHLIGVALNTLLLSLALADRINVLRREKEQMQKQALEVQRRAAETLEQEVQNRTQELKQAYESLAEHDRIKSRFFANVSHEVRTPLTLILTPLQRLLAEEGDSVSEGAKEKLRAMVGNVQRLRRLVNQLLDFSRLESGGSTVSYERVDVGPMVASIVESFQSFAHTKGITLTLTAAKDLPEVYVDPPKLDKVVSNLLSNACKFSEAGDNVLVKLNSDNKWLSIEVQDTGIGIPEEELPHIFERFRQVDGSSSRKHEGTGIGLALSKELVTLLGGELTVESKPRLGSAFTVLLPLGKQHIADPSQISEGQGRDYATTAQETAAALTAETGLQEPREASAEEVREVPPDEGDMERPQVLVVEDNPDMRGLIHEICQDTFAVVEAADGQQALERIRQRRPALVISDIMMPVMDGYKLVQHIREDPATESLPVLLLTAKAGPEMLAEGLACGANDYLAKPFESQELLARARNLVRMEQQDRELRRFNERLQEELVGQAAALERARMLGRYVSPAVVYSIMEEGQDVQVDQERRRLTVFLLELRGFDSMAEDLEPEEMTAMLNGYLSAMMEVALAHGATVDRLNQDVVGGFFGAPTSDGPEPDAIRCARMAQKMWGKAVEICLDWRGHQVKVPPNPTMVLVSGFATVGNFGSSNRLEYTAVGGSVNQARILLPAVKPGSIVCTQSTWSLIKDEVESELAETVKAPQWSNPIDLYRLTSTRSPEADTMNLVPGSTPSSLPSGEVKVLDQPSGNSRSEGSKTSQDPEHLRPGTVVGHRYEVARLLGKGGMGVVYKVNDLKLETAVALKLILKNLRDSPKLLKRLYREVKLARLISHPNVARIYDLDEWEGLEFITMEYIDGETLSYRLKEGGAFDLDLGIEVLKQICLGLSAAHLAGIVHRDLKPSNVMIDGTHRVTIMDFGIARWANPVHQSGDVSLGISGTPLYMAPEQFKSGATDQRTDIYALGCLAYCLFTGERPFEKGDMAAMCYQHTQVMPPPPRQLNPKISPRLSAVIMRCLQKEPADRFSRVEEITALLGGDNENEKVA